MTSERAGEVLRDILDNISNRWGGGYYKSINDIINDNNEWAEAIVQYENVAKLVKDAIEESMKK